MSSNVHVGKKWDILLIVCILTLAFSIQIQLALAKGKGKGASPQDVKPAKNEVDSASENEQEEEEEIEPSADEDRQESGTEEEEEEASSKAGAGPGAGPQLPIPKDPAKILGAAPKVTIDQGELVGLKLAARGGSEYFSYRQVPYATQVRFKDAIPSPKFQGVFNATNFLSTCPQIYMIKTGIPTGAEDCLTLNVYTPNVSGGKKLPVMVFIHGGAMTFGSSSLAHGDYFMENGDVVVVTINYRLGALGLLSTGDAVIPGNFGFKDCIVALKWVRKNIGQFGGAKSKVTIFGQSAGSIIVSYLLLSPKAKGLFHAAILQSGTALMLLSLPRKGLGQTKKFSKAVGCPFSGAGIEDSKQFLKCLERKSPAEILIAQQTLNEWSMDPFCPFGIVLEPKGYKRAFLTQHPERLLIEGRINRVPVIISQVEDEGFLLHTVSTMANASLLQDFNENWKTVFPITFNYGQMYFPDMSEKERNRISETIRKVYFHNEPVTEENANDMMDAYSDLWFNYGNFKFAKLLARHTHVYLAFFAHKRMDFDFPAVFQIQSKDKTSVTHTEELTFLFSNIMSVYPDFKENSPSELVSKNLVKLWVSFATDGKPTYMWPKIAHWTPMSRKEYQGKTPLKFLRIDVKNQIIVESPTLVERHKILEQLFGKLYKLPHGQYHNQYQNQHHGSRRHGYDYRNYNKRM